LKFLRSSKGLKQSDLAHKLDVKTNTVSNYENGVSEPDFKILDLIVKIFDIDSFDLLFKDLASQSTPDNAYTQKEANSDILSEPSSDKGKISPTGNCNNCTEKERIIKALQVTIDELRSDKAYLKEEIKELKIKLGLSETKKS
jgi:transcriptional regulator with XRE-family HTH domain